MDYSDQDSVDRRTRTTSENPERPPGRRPFIPFWLRGDRLIRASPTSERSNQPLVMAVEVGPELDRSPFLHPGGPIEDVDRDRRRQANRPFRAPRHRLLDPRFAPAAPFQCEARE